MTRATALTAGTALTLIMTLTVPTTQASEVAS
jgi:hypothetical protein